MIVAHTVTEFQGDNVPFYRLTGTNTGDGTLGCVAIQFLDRPGTLYQQTNNQEELEWWFSLLSGYPEVTKMWFIPAADSHESALPFTPPELTPAEALPK